MLGGVVSSARTLPPGISPESTKDSKLPRHLLDRADVFGIGFLLGIPLFVFSLAALAGYPLLTGDDVTQNYPLSVLAGQFLAHGQLPVYDPYLWAGTPLLAGANAHALLPTTVLFAFLPPLGAWVIAEALTLSAAAIGAFVLLRRNRCRSLAALLGGATFGLGGFVSSQVVHIDFVAASAALVWCLVALDGIVRAGPRARAAWTLVLAAAVACVGLSGSPDIVIDAIVACSIYGGHLLLTARGRRICWMLWTSLGVLTGLAISAVQWLPTAEFLSVSERAHPGYVFAAAGSVSAAELLVSLVPHVLGGGPIGLETYTGPYSLAELDAYCGILSLVALVALPWRWRSDSASRWRVWYVVGGLGLVIALGSHTPIERLLVHLPLVGEQRLPSRALILFSLASSLLVGFWIEDEIASETRDLKRPAALGGLVAVAAVLGLLIATASTGRPYGGLLEALTGSSWSLAAIAPYLGVATVIALAAGAIVILGPSWPRPVLTHAIVAVVVADLLVFTANQSSLAPVYLRALKTGSSLQRQLAARLEGGARYLVVDPARLAGVALDQAGGSDLNVLSRLSSAQGYGSLVWGPYASATGAHSLDDIDPHALATGVFDALDVRLLLTVPQELSLARVKIDVAPGAGPGTPPGIDAPPIASVGPVRSPILLGPGESASRWFGRTIVASSVTLQLSPETKEPSHQALALLGRDLRLVAPSGVQEPATGLGAVISEPGTRTVVIVFKLRKAFVGLVTANPLASSVRIGSVTLTGRSGISYDLDGALSAYLSAPHWVPAGTIGPFAVFANKRASGSFYLASATRPGPHFGVRVVSSSPFSPTETVEVTSSAPGTVVRSVAAIPGWSATAERDGHSRPIALVHDGLVQSFKVSEGSTLVTFRYDAPGLKPALALSALGLVAFFAVGLIALLGRRRRFGARTVADPQKT